jgi:hypothetical protein
VTAPLLDRSLPDLLRPHYREVAQEIEREIRLHVLDCAQAMDGEYGTVVRQTINETVAYFINSLGREQPDWTDLSQLFGRLGAEMARQGNDLDLLQTALRLSSQIACRRFIKDAYRLDWPRETLAALTDTLFALLAHAADAGAQGYARQQGHMATDRARHRAKLRELLIRDPPASVEALTEQANAAGWKVPNTIAVVALPSGPRPPRRILPPDVLQNWDSPTPYLIVPEPDLSGRERLPTLLTPLGTAAIGPTVSVSRAASSLRWARHTVTLIERGILPSRRPVRSVDHTALLAASMAEDLIDASAATLLAPFLALTPGRRLPLVTTLLAYLRCGGNAVIASEQLQVHQQTVRYRLRRIADLTGKPINDPAGRLDLMIVLNWLLHADRGEHLNSKGAG